VYPELVAQVNANSRIEIRLKVGEESLGVPRVSLLGCRDAHGAFFRQRAYEDRKRRSPPKLWLVPNWSVNSLS